MKQDIINLGINFVEDAKGLQQNSLTLIEIKNNMDYCKSFIQFLHLCLESSNSNLKTLILVKLKQDFEVEFLKLKTIEYLSCNNIQN